MTNNKKIQFKDEVEKYEYHSKEKLEKTIQKPVKKVINANFYENCPNKYLLKYPKRISKSCKIGKVIQGYFKINKKFEPNTPKFESKGNSFNEVEELEFDSIVENFTLNELFEQHEPK